METRNIISQDDSGKHESDPLVVFQQFMDLLKAMQAKYPEVKHLIYSSQMHALLATDSNGEDLQKTMTWADLRAKNIGYEKQISCQVTVVFTLSGTPIQSMNSFVKLAYLNQSRLDLFWDPSIQFMDIKAYIIRRLTGEYVIDYATASSMGLMDL